MRAKPRMRSALPRLTWAGRAKTLLHVGNLNGINVHRHYSMMSGKFHRGAASRGDAVEQTPARPEHTKLNCGVFIHAPEQQLASLLRLALLGSSHLARPLWAQWNSTSKPENWQKPTRAREKRNF